ncbi:D-tyrosyl-tRNA(Tyr) deacylase [Clostridia bacterium]|nr:D-tyrosyl-tRNA(Tyr) deacylase [Clostridia bacterium]
MRAVVQRTRNSKVEVEGQIVGSIDKGMVVLLGVEDDDTEKDSSLMAKKIAKLRIYPDENGKLNHSIGEGKGEVLLISQFTLLGDARKGNRPSFSKAAEPKLANSLYLLVKKELETTYGLTVETGKFRCNMQVSLLNDGPVTILLDTKKQF